MSGKCKWPKMAIESSARQIKEEEDRIFLEKLESFLNCPKTKLSQIEDSIEKIKNSL